MATVLVVDDDQKLLNMVRRTLAHDGIDASIAMDGIAALEQARAARPDVVVLDWLMPELDGISPLRRMRAAGDRTPIMMLTARDGIEDRVEGLESGADDYLVKPFASAELLASLHALLRRTSVAAEDQPLVYGDLFLNPLTRETRRGERAFELTTKEFDLYGGIPVEKGAPAG